MLDGWTPRSQQGWRWARDLLAGDSELVQEGVLASPFTRMKVVRFCRDQWSRLT